MSTKEVTLEDYRFFDFLAPYRWPDKTQDQIQAYRDLVDTGELQIESLLENTLALNSNGLYEKISEDSRDATDNSDAKKCCSQFRNNHVAKNQWMNTFAITNLQNKIGLIRAMCYSREQDQFYFFAIPHKAYSGMRKIDIILDQSTGYKEPTGIPQGKWARYEVKDFKTLATITEEQAEEMMPPSAEKMFQQWFRVELDNQ